MYLHMIMVLHVSDVSITALQLEPRHDSLNFCLLLKINYILYDFLVTVKEAPHECVIKTGQPLT